MTPIQLTEALHSPLADRFVLTLAHFLWQGTIIALAVLATSSACGNSVRRRYTVSLCGLFALAICPLITFACVESPAEDSDARPSAFTNVDAAGIESPNSELDFAAIPATSDELLSTASPWLLTAWLIGVALLSSRLLLGVFSIAWLKRTGELAGESLIGQTRHLSRRLNMAAPAVRVSRHVSEAIAVGFFRPVIVIPTAWLIQLPPECLEAVLAHELAHIRRHDLWINLLQRIVETLMFFHPAVWWLSNRLRQEREMCCDELAVSLTGRRVEYASTLELVARRRCASGAPALAAGIGGGRMALLNRVRNILGLAPQHSGAGPWTLGVATVVAAGGVWWLATGGSPLAAFAGEEDEMTLIALADDEEGEGEGEGQRDGDRDGDREEKGERRERDGDRERAGPRDGDRERDERDGDRAREGERDRPREEERRDGDRETDRPNPEQFRRHIEEMKGRVRALAEQGRREEAERLEREIRGAVERFERAHRPDGERANGERREPHPEIHPEVREHLEQLHRRMREAAEAGRKDEAHRLEREIHAVHERIRAQHVRDGDHRDGERRDGEHVERDRPRPDAGARDRELLEVIQALRLEVGRLREEVNGLKRGGGDRPRFEAHPPVERDRPRREGESDRPREREERRDGDREGGDRDREEG